MDQRCQCMFLTASVGGLRHMLGGRKGGSCKACDVNSMFASSGMEWDKGAQRLDLGAIIDTEIFFLATFVPPIRSR